MARLNKQQLQRWATRWTPEIWCGLVSWIVLIVLALYMLGTGLLTPHGDAIGAYLGYDNYFRFTTSGGAWDASHPLVTPLYFINRQLIVPLLGESGALLLALLTTSLLTALALAGCTGYLRQVVGLSLRRSILLTGLLGVSFTTLTISFTIESYPLSMALLVLSLLAISLQIQQRGTVSLAQVSLWSILLGGVTLTNFAKPLALVLLGSGSLWHKVRKMLIPTAILLALVIAVGWVYQQRRTAPEESMLSYQVSDLLRFQSISSDVVQDFFGHPLLISDLAPRTLNAEETLRPTPYKAWAAHLLPWSVILILLSMLVVGRRYRLAWAIPLYLAVDIAVHIVGGYGLNEAIIFGGHWAFLVPMALGWLYKVMPQRAYRYVDIALLLLIIYMGWHNLSVILTRLA